MKPKTPLSFPLFFHIVHNDPVVNTITTIMPQLDELPTITPGAIIAGIQIIDPDGGGTGTAGAGSRGEIPLILTGRIFSEEVSEEWFEEGRTAADETGVDFDDAFGDTWSAWGKKEWFKRRGSKGKKAHVMRKVFASNQGVSGALRLMTNRAKRKVVIAQLLR